MNWRTIVGIILILGSINEMYWAMVAYREGKSEATPYDLLISYIIVVFLACLLIRKGMQVSRNKMRK